MVDKIDSEKQRKQLFAPKCGPCLVDAPQFRQLTIDGEESPEDATFREAIEAFHSTAYKSKFRLEKAGHDDFVVPPLEELWGPMTNLGLTRIAAMSGGGR